MTVLNEIRHLRGLLDHKNRWFIETHCPDNDTIIAIAESAKDYATQRLSNISTGMLYYHFRDWFEKNRKSYMESYHSDFLDDLINIFGLKSCKRDEKTIYNESITLKLKFI